MSNSLRPHGQYSPWNSPDQNTGVGSLSLLQGIFQPRDQTQVSCIASGFFTSWAIREAHYLLKLIKIEIIKEIEFLFKNFPTNKTPVPNSFTSNFYQTLKK